MNIFRIHIRPGGGTADMETTFNYCKDNSILGVGWRIGSANNTKNWDEYFTEAKDVHKNLQICKYIRKWVSEGDLVWTRDASGKYYLARITSGWEYWRSPPAIELDIDIANIFRCVFKQVEIDKVPGKIVASFRPRKTIQSIDDKKAGEYSKYLWNMLSGENIYEIDKAGYSDIFTFLDDEETEDLLFLYLQANDWYVVPNSRKGDTMNYEFYAVHRRMPHETAITQVKTGNSAININEYREFNGKIFLFQSNGLYTGEDAENVIRITRGELCKFLIDSLAWLPNLFQKKVEIVGLERLQNGLN